MIRLADKCVRTNVSIPTEVNILIAKPSKTLFQSSDNPDTGADRCAVYLIMQDECNCDNYIIIIQKKQLLFSTILGNLRLMYMPIYEPLSHIVRSWKSTNLREYKSPR